MVFVLYVLQGSPRPWVYTWLSSFIVNKAHPQKHLVLSSIGKNRVRTNPKVRLCRGLFWPGRRHSKTSKGKVRKGQIKSRSLSPVQDGSSPKLGSSTRSAQPTRELCALGQNSHSSNSTKLSVAVQTSERSSFSSHSCLASNHSENTLSLKHFTLAYLSIFKLILAL